jgi:hypothetical protein
VLGQVHAAAAGEQRLAYDLTEALLCLCLSVCLSLSLCLCLSVSPSLHAAAAGEQWLTFNARACMLSVQAHATAAVAHLRRDRGPP